MGLAVEAMSRGCITIVGQFDYISDNFSHFAPVEVRRANLKDKLISLILNKKLRLKIAKSLNFYKNTILNIIPLNTIENLNL